MISLATGGKPVLLAGCKPRVLARTTDRKMKRFTPSDLCINRGKAVGGLVGG